MSSPSGDQQPYAGGFSQPGPHNSPQDPQAAQQAFSQGQPYGANPAADQQAFSQGQPFGASQPAFSQGQPYGASQPAFSQNPPAGAAPGAANASAPGAASGSAAGGVGGFGQPQAPKQPSAFGLREILLAVGAFLVFVSVFPPQYKWGTDSFYQDGYEWLWSFSLNGSGVLMLGVLPVLAAGLIGVLNKTVRSFPQHIGSYSPDQFVTALAVSGAAVQFVRFIHLFAFSTPSWGAFIGLLGAGLAAFVTAFTMIPALGASEFDARESVPAHPKARPVRRAPAQAPAVQPGFGQPGFAQAGAAQPGPAQPGFTQPGFAQPDPGQPVPAQNSPSQPGYAQAEPAQAGPAQAEPAQPGFAQHGLEQRGSAQNSPAQHGPDQPGSAQPGFAQAGPAQSGFAQPEPAQPVAPAASETAEPVAPAASEPEAPEAHALAAEADAEPTADAASEAPTPGAKADEAPAAPAPAAGVDEAPVFSESSAPVVEEPAESIESSVTDSDKTDFGEPEQTAPEPSETQRDAAEVSGTSSAEPVQKPVQESAHESVEQEETQLFQPFPMSQTENAQPDQEEPAQQEPVQEETQLLEQSQRPQPQQIPFWFAVPEPRVAVDPAGNPAFHLEPGKWILAMSDNGDSFTVQSEDGRIGELRNIHGVERG